MKTHIVLATDLEAGSRSAEVTAFAMAKKFDAPLTLIFVDTWSLNEDALAHAREQLLLEKKIKDQMASIDEGISYKIIVESGAPSARLLHWIESSCGEDTLCVIGRKNRSGIENFVMGSTAVNLLEAIKVPVLVVPESSDVLCASHVLCARDFLAADECASKKAAEFALAWNGSVTLLHAYEPKNYQGLLPEFYSSNEVFREIETLNHNEQMLKQREVDDHAQRMTQDYHLQTHGYLLQGSTKESILSYVKESHSDLLVVGKCDRERNGGLWSYLRRAVSGSIACDLAMQAQTKVLVVPHVH